MLEIILTLIFLVLNPWQSEFLKKLSYIPYSTPLYVLLTSFQLIHDILILKTTVLHFQVSIKFQGGIFTLSASYRPNFS